MSDGELHYRHPPAKAFRLNKLLYRVRMDPVVRKQFMTDPDSVIAEYRLSPEEIEAAKQLDVNALSSLGAHPLLGFMARFNVEHDKRAAGDRPR
jgi:hypothetical protein